MQERGRMRHMLSHTGFTGRKSGRPAVCPRVWDIAAVGRGRRLPFGWET